MFYDVNFKNEQPEQRLTMPNLIKSSSTNSIFKLTTVVVNKTELDVLLAKKIQFYLITNKNVKIQTEFLFYFWSWFHLNCSTGFGI